MLQNLHDIAISARQRYRDEFSFNEVILSQSFKDVYGAALRRDQQDIDFTAHTAIITTSGNLKMYIPNQWFCAAAYTVEFVQVFMRYKELTDAIVSAVTASTQAKKDYIKRLKETSDSSVIDAYRTQVRSYMSAKVPENELDDTVELLTRFATDYEWWFGSKTIDRGDAYVSPVLSLLGVVNASQGYIADISYKFATEPALTYEAGNMIDDVAMSTLSPVETVVTPTEGGEQPRLTGGFNEIVYGAPGTGKSRYLDDNYAGKNKYSRVVFHPEYTYFDFVGTYKPTTLYKESDVGLQTLSGHPFVHGEPVIDYKFVPGPFTSILVSAWTNPTIMHTLIIEEINRANAAAVFGQIFQLLDRDVNGTSEYWIEPSEDLLQYLMSVPGMSAYLDKGLKIPSNMNIVATMNSADQGVMPMDAAFKRRWSFKYIKISIEGAVHEKALLSYAGHDITWGNLVRAINAKLMGLGLEEDRLVGPYFIKPDEIGSRRATDKLLLYLWDDVLRYNREAFFNNQVHTFADLSDTFNAKDVFDLLGGPYASLLSMASDPDISEPHIDAKNELPADE